MNGCKVCDSEKVVAVGAAERTNFAPCPVCVGIRLDSLFQEEVEHVEQMCLTEGVEPLWLV